MAHVALYGYLEYRFRIRSAILLVVTTVQFVIATICKPTWKGGRHGNQTNYVVD